MTKPKKILGSVLVFLIVGFVYAAFFPSYSKVRPESITHANTNALRCLQAALSAYAQDHDGRFAEALDVAAISFPEIERIKKQVDSQADGDIQYFPPRTKLQETDPNHILLIWPHSYGVSLCFADGRGIAFTKASAGWTKTKRTPNQPLQRTPDTEPAASAESDSRRR